MPGRLHNPITDHNSGNASWARQMSNGGLHAHKPVHWWCKRVRFSDLTLPAATGAQFSLNALFPDDPFPTNVERAGLSYIGVETPWAGTGITGITAALGTNGGDVDQFVNESTVSGGVARWLTTPSSGDVVLPYGNYHAALVPGLQLDAAGGPNLSAITAGVLWVAIPYARMPGVFEV